MGKATPKSGKNNKKRRKINSNSYNKTGNATTTTKENKQLQAIPVCPTK